VGTTAADQGTCDRDQADPGKCKAGNIALDRFMVFWTIDYGYRLNPGNDMSTIIIPEFDSLDVMEKFNKFFANDNLSRHVGKRVHCDCLGERFERDGGVFYKIREAHLFGR
jgi:hypothetical protein